MSSCELGEYIKVDFYYYFDQYHLHYDLGYDWKTAQFEYQFRRYGCSGQAVDVDI